MPGSYTLPSQEELKGLRNEGQWNPVLPSSPEDEQLTPILSSRMTSNSTNQGGPVHAADNDQDFSHDDHIYENFDFSNAFLDEAESQNFDDRTFFRTNTGLTQDEPMSATSLSNRSLQTASRKSTGLANMSSQLMSPVLTVIASPGSTGIGDSPIIHHKVLGGGFAEDLSSEETFGYSSHTNETPVDSKGSTNTSIQSQKQSTGRAPPTPEVNRKRRGSGPTLQTPEEEFVQYEDTRTEAQPRQGIDPGSRMQIKDAKVESLTEQATKRAVQAKNADISNWLFRSELTPADQAHLSGVNPGATVRRRSRSTGDQIILPPHILSQVPIEEEHSEDEGNDSDLGSYHAEAPANFSARPHTEPTTAINTGHMDSHPKPQDAFPWVDPIKFPSEEGSVGQPGTSNEAVMRFLNRAKDIETASRAATWGTQRRMSEGDPVTWNYGDSEMQRIWGHSGLFSRLSLTREKEEEYREEWRNFKEHAKEKAARWWPKKESVVRPAEPIRSPSKDSMTSPAASIKSKRESTHDLAESLKMRLHRHSNARKPRSSDSEMQGQGLSERSSSPTETSSPTHTHTHAITALAHAARGRLSRHGSKDDAFHLASLWRTSSGGPPIAYPKLTQSPPVKQESQFQPPATNQSHIIDGLQVAEPTPINTGFHLERQLPIPTLEGFKIDARRRLPHLTPFLVDRLALEQLRRYKKLVEFKVKHAKLVATNSCPSGPHCVAREGLVTTFPAKAQKEALVSHAGLNMAGEVDEDDEALDEGILTENSFPPGMPATPAKRLPAQFECPLCFQVKKFTKPSDWSKHVHEDLQPFTCTFVECPEPKSFKRKADWVRHENERHRHLEWWQCTEEGCSHQCYRRDNFVQHLCREHKMPEPKAKNAKPENGPAVRGPAKTKGKGNIEFTPETKVLWMVENCRHNTTNRAIDEACRLCGRSFSTFKKLTVDLAKHMEDLSLPVLELVNLKTVNTETVVSPIDVKPPRFSSTDQSPYIASSSISPYDQALGISTGMADLPGAFAPLHTVTTFQQPQFGSVSWTQHQPGQAIFTGPIDAWPSENAHYGTQNNHLFNGGTVYGGQQQQQQPQSNEYSHMPTAMPQGLGMSFHQDDSALLTDMNVSPGYAETHYGEISSAHAPHQSPPLGYAGELHGSYDANHSGQHDGSTMYGGQDDQQQLHIQQAAQHQSQTLLQQQQQQQQQQQSQHQQHFYQSTY